MSNKAEHITFEKIVREYHPMVFRTALGFVHNKEDAEDLTQEAFLRAYRAWGHFRGDAEVSTWLYRITINLSLNYINIKNRKGWLQLGEEAVRKLLNLESDGCNPQEELEQQESERRVAAAIDSLPDKQRTAFVLLRYEELPQKEVAQIMGVSEGAVEQLLIRAKTNLQKKLTPPIGNRK
ncbi:MAG: RNA polymerase sigma factor [Bacteroides sp.]